MLLQIVSDLHLEFDEVPFELPPVEGRDLLILAGDIAVQKKALGFVQTQLEHSPVVYVPGNHEYYGRSIERVDRFWEGVNLPYFTYAPCVVRIIDRVAFCLGTLWTDVDNGNEHSKYVASRAMHEFRGGVKYQNRHFTPDDSIQLHKKTLDTWSTWLEQNKSLYDKVVVISHHAPHVQSIAKKYDGDLLNPCFYTDLSWFIELYRPVLWAHGHMHNSFDYKIGDTRVVCNPRGYFDFELNPNFDPKFCVNI